MSKNRQKMQEEKYPEMLKLVCFQKENRFMTSHKTRVKNTIEPVTSQYCLKSLQEAKRVKKISRLKRIHHMQCMQEQLGHFKMT